MGDFVQIIEAHPAPTLLAAVAVVLGGAIFVWRSCERKGRK
jgi:hypothetical protein